MELRRVNAIGDVLVLLEHPPVLTLGRNAGRDNRREHVIATEAELSARGVAVHVVKRGGDVTYHGPGQLVGYPILDLRDQQMESDIRMGVVDYVRRLEEVLIRVGGEHGVRAQRVSGRTGVWTLPGGVFSGNQLAARAANGLATERKLAAIGVHVSRGITSHGFALNVTADLRDFKWIVPCGIADRLVTNLADEVEDSEQLTVASVGQSVARNFGRVFAKQVLAAEAPEAIHPELRGW